MPPKDSQNKILWFFLSLFILSIFLFGWLLLPFLSVIVLAWVVTGVFYPLYRFFAKKDKITPPLASLFTCIMIFFILFVPIVFFVGILANEAQDFIILARDAFVGGQIESLLEDNTGFVKARLLLEKFNIELTSEKLSKWIADSGQVIGAFLFNQAKSIGANMLKFFVNFFFMLLIIFYLLMDGEKLISFIVDLSPLPTEQDEKLIQKFKDISGAILIGNGLGGLIQGALGGIVFWFFGFKSPFLWGFIMALLAFLPILGIGAVLIPTAILLFLKGQMGAGTFFIIFYIILSGGIEYIFKPKLVGDRVKMHTLIVFLAIIGGLNLFGILGIIYGPLIVTFFLTLTDIYHASYQEFVEPDQ